MCAQSVAEQLLSNQIINKTTQIQIFMSFCIFKTNLVLKPRLQQSKHFSTFNKDKTHKILK